MTPRRLLVIAALGVALLLGVAYGAAALWDYKKQTDKEVWDRIRTGTFFRR